MRVGRKISWPKFLTPEEMCLSARSEVTFLAEDSANPLVTVTELGECISNLRSAIPGTYNIHYKYCPTELLYRIMQLLNEIWKQQWKYT